MRRILKVVGTLILGACASTPLYAQSTTYTTPTINVNKNAKETIRVYWTTSILIEVINSEGVVTLTVYRDGRVSSKDKKKLNKNAKLFWHLFAQYNSLYCPLNEEVKNGNN